MIDRNISKKERRIDNALIHKNKKDLEWALKYAKKKKDSVSKKELKKHWKHIIEKIKAALKED